MPAKTQEQQEKGKFGSGALTAAFIALAAVTVIGVFQWTLVEYVTVLLEPLVEIAIGAFLLVTLIWSIVHLLRTWRRGPWTAAALLPLVVCLFAASVAIFVPFTEIMLDLDFRVHYAARMAVVDNVLAGKYDAQVQNLGARGDLIALHGRDFRLSSDGEVLRFHNQDRTLIFFFSFRGILDSFSGFVYSSDNSPPKDDEFGGRFVEVTPLRKNWFWAASRN